MANHVLGPLIAKQTLFSGAGYIAGTVTVNTAPAARWVLLRHRRSGLAVATTFSAADGTYQFDRLDPAEEYDVIVRDYARVYKDYIEPAVVPAT